MEEGRQVTNVNTMAKVSKCPRGNGMEQNLKGKDCWASRGQQAHSCSNALARAAPQLQPRARAGVSGAVSSGAAGARVSGPVSKGQRAPRGHIEQEAEHTGCVALQHSLLLL